MRTEGKGLELTIPKARRLASGLGNQSSSQASLRACEVSGQALNHEEIHEMVHARPWFAGVGPRVGTAAGQEGRPQELARRLHCRQGASQENRQADDGRLSLRALSGLPPV